MRQAGSRGHDEAVSSVVGTVLMLGITVAVFTAFAVVVLSSVTSAPRAPRAELGVLQEGSSYLLVNHGGEAVELGGGHIVLNVGGTPRTVPLSTFAAAGYVGSGTWTAGQSICIAGPSTATRTCYIDTASQPNPDVRGVAIVVEDAALAMAGVLSGGASEACSTDTQAPTALWVQAPSDVSVATVGAVTVTATASDDCSGVDPGVTPSLSWRLEDGSGVAYTNAGPMQAVGAGTWRGTIPAQAWSSSAGKTLQYRAGPLADLAGNSGTTAARSDFVQPIGSIQFPTAYQAIAGTVSGFAAAQSSSDAGATATLAEAAQALRLAASGVDTALTGANWQSPSLALGSDDAWATATSPGQNLQLALADPPAIAGPITQVLLVAEGSVVGASSGDGFGLRACLAASCGTQSGTLAASATDGTVQFDVTAARPGGGSWTWADLANLELQVQSVRSNPSGETWRVDDAYAIVSYGLTSATLGADGAVSFLSWSSPSSAATSDNLYASYDQDANPPDSLQLSLGNPAANANAITRVTLKAETSITGRTNDGFTLQACLGATCSAASPSFGGATDAVTSYDVTALRPGGGSWTWTDVANLEARLNPVRTGTRDGAWRVDAAWVETEFAVPLSASAVVSSSGWSSASLALASDDQYATNNNNNPSLLQVSFPNPGTPGTRVSTVTLGLEQQLQGKIDDGWTLQACLSGTCSTASALLAGTAGDTVVTYDVSSLRPGGGTWSLTDMQTLQARVNPTVVGNKADGMWKVDVATLTVGYVDVQAAEDATSQVSWSNWPGAQVSDDVPATYARNTSPPDYLQLTLADPPAGAAGTITQVLVKAELSIAGKANDDFALQACFGLTCSAQGPALGVTATDAVYTLDATTLRPGGGSWSWSDIAALEARAVPLATGSRDGTWRVDRVWLEVSSPAYTETIEVSWTGVPAGTHALQLSARTVGETFRVQVWDGTAWNTRGAALASDSLTPWVYTMTAAEWQSGAPRLRFVDVLPTSPVQGTLHLDYVEVVTS